MQSKSRIIAISFLFLISTSVPFVSSAGGGGGGGGAAASVSILDYQYSSNNVTINMGEAVEWIHQGSAPHTVTDNGAPEPFDSGSMQSGDTFTFTFTTAGAYPYKCTVHPSMTGDVYVIDPNAGSGSNGSGSNQSSQNQTVNVTMAIWMPEGVESRESFDVENGSSVWDASAMGFAKLNVAYEYTDDPSLGIFVNSIAGLSSDAEFGEPEYWYWALYVMNSTGVFEESPMGASSLNVSDLMTFSWVATNGSWGPMEGSVNEMLSGMNQTITGCTDSNATNFDSDANEDDGSCEYASPTPVEGCTNQTADNYNELAETDDGSCTFSADNQTMQEDCVNQGGNWTEAPDRPDEYYCDFGDDPSDDSSNITQEDCELRAGNWTEYPDQPDEYYCDFSDDSEQSDDSSNSQESNTTSAPPQAPPLSETDDDRGIPGFTGLLTATALLGAVLYLDRRD